MVFTLNQAGLQTSDDMH